MNLSELLLDKTDYRIMKSLSKNGRATDVMIGEQISLSSSAVARRRKIMEENGVIAGYAARLNLGALGFSGVAFVSVELISQAEAVLIEFEREVRKCPSVSYCGFVSGGTDFIMLLHVSSFDDYDKVYRREISSLPHVAKIKSSFVLREVSGRTTPSIIFK